MDAPAVAARPAVRRVAVFGRSTSTGFSTNDAGHLEVSDCLVVGCDMAFQGYDHLSFKVRDALVLDCGQPFNESASHRPVPPATSRIDRGEGVRALDASALRDARRLREIEDFLETSLYPAGPDAGSSGPAGPVRAVAALVRGLILEDGCGVGMYLSRLAQTAELAVGLDIEHPRLLEARQQDARVVCGVGKVASCYSNARRGRGIVG